MLTEVYKKPFCVLDGMEQSQGGVVWDSANRPRPHSTHDGLSFDYSLVDVVKNRILEMCNPEKIYIFGSVSRHEAGPDSDIDVLIVMETDLQYFTRPVEFYRAFTRMRIFPDIIVVTPSEVEKALKVQDQFIEDIIYKGDCVYERIP